MKSTFLKTVLTLFIINFLFGITHAQISINEDGSSPDASAILDVKSSDKGVLVPRMDSSARNTISNPAVGLLVYDTTTVSFWYFDNSQWNEIQSSSTRLNATDLLDTINTDDLDYSCLSLKGSVGIGNSPEALTVVDNYAYVTDRDDDDLKIYDVSNPNSPTFVGSVLLDNDPNKLAIYGNYAYVIYDDEGVDTISIVDVSDKNNPIFVMNFGFNEAPSFIDVQGNYAYFSASNGYLIILDISSSTPVITSSTQVGTHDMHQVVVSGNYAYLTDIGGSGTLRVVDISNKSNPITVSSIGISLSPEDIEVSGDYVYIIDSYSQNLKIIDVSDKNNPTLSSSFSIGSLPRSIEVLGDYVYMTELIGDNFEVIDVSDKTNPSLLHTFDFGYNSIYMEISDNYAYYTNHYTNELYVVQLFCDNLMAFNPLTGTFESRMLNDNQTIDEFSLSGNDLQLSLENDGQNTLTVDLSNYNNDNASVLQDTDNDTKIQVEKNNDEDIIRFDLGGTEYFKFNNGRIEVLNTGRSTFLGNGAGVNDNLSSSNNDNVFIGDSSGYNNINGYENVFVGYESGYSGSSSSFKNNTFIGYQAGFHNTTFNNTFLGFRAGYRNTTGFNNVFIGLQSGYNNTDGEDNVFIGRDAGYGNTTGEYNTFVGRSAGRNNTIGEENVFLGRSAGIENTTGNYNVFLGKGAGQNNTTANQNTFIGTEAGYNNTIGGYNVFIGYQAGYSETDSNKLYIENSGSSSPLIYGDFTADSLQINGKLNINGVYNFPTTDGLANQVLATNGNGTVSWANSSTDNLGNHTAIQNIELNGNWISNDGDNQGIKIDDYGRVGIGTSNPLYSLDIQGTNGKRTRVYTADTTFAGYLSKNSTREFFAGVQGTHETNDVSSGYHIFDNTAFASRFVIDKDGDVGIGEDNPNAKLHVKGDFRLVDGTQSAGKVLTSDANGFASWESQNLTLSNDELSISGSSNTVDLSGYLDNTDDQTIDVFLLSNDNLQLSLERDGENTKTISLSNYKQTLSLSNDNLSISNGNSIALNSAFLSSNGATYSTNIGDDFIVGDSDNFSYSSGTENKFFFDNSRGAIRAGGVTGTNWDESNIGFYSVSFGKDNLASSLYSTAIGNMNNISGAYSMGFGLSNNITGSFSTSIGVSNTISNNQAVAIGTSNTSSALDAITIGHSNTSSAEHAIAIGHYATAPSFGEIALGLYNTTYSADNTTAVDDDDRLLVIGNGTAPNSLSDALRIFKDGKSYFYGDAAGDNDFVMTIDNTLNSNSSRNNGLLIKVGHSTYNSNNRSSFVEFESPDGDYCGRIRQTGNASVSFQNTSDIRLKENIRPTQYGLADILKIEVRDYNYISDAKNNQHTGFIAQQLHTVFPVVVEEGGEDAKTNPWTVDYAGMTPLLVKGMQDLSIENEALKIENDKQQTEIDLLKNQMSTMSQQNAEMKAMLEQIQAEINEQ